MQNPDLPQMSHGLNLVLTMSDPKRMPLLLKGLAARQDQIRLELRKMNVIHFARFLPLRDHSALLVITEFDGPLKPYVLDFVLTIGDSFNLLLSFTKDAPPLPVQKHPRAFWNFIELNNRVNLTGLPVDEDAEYTVFSAYPRRSVPDILQRRAAPVPGKPDALANRLLPTGKKIERPVEEAKRPYDAQLPDIQGNLLRSYRAGQVWHWVLVIDNPRLCRAFLSACLDPQGPHPVSTSALYEQGKRPHTWLNIGFTHTGLQAMGLSASWLAELPEAFVQGPADPKRALAVGDIGDNRPSNWDLGGPGQPWHLWVSLSGYDDQSGEFSRLAQVLTTAFERHQLSVRWTQLAERLPQNSNKFSPDHFGFRDGLSQPRIQGIQSRRNRDFQPEARLGEFLLGARYEDIYGGDSLGNMPAALCENGTFLALRVMAQDVPGFHRMLDEAAKHTRLAPDVIAAKMVGRRQDGQPLLPKVSPGLDRDGRPLDPNSNSFDYAHSGLHPDTHNDPRLDDQDGLGCPIGAHVRRMNPRSALVAGCPYSRRLIRRGLPYGEAWRPGENDDAPRGLVGQFYCADLERQYEFMLGQWGNGDHAAPNIAGTQDPIIGNQALGGGFGFSAMDTQGQWQRHQVPVQQLVRTRGSLYLLVPGLNALRWLSQNEPALPAPDETQDRPLPSAPSAPATVQAWAQAWGTREPIPNHRVNPQTFDLKSPAYLAQPYRHHALFREVAPVLRVRHGAYDSVWVFSHALVVQVCQDATTFTKPVKGKDKNGLFFMDAPRHTEVSGLLKAVFDAATQNIAAVASTAADQALQAMQKKLENGQAVDLVHDYAHPLTRDIFMEVFGVPAARRRIDPFTGQETAAQDRETWDDAAMTCLNFADPTLPEAQRSQAFRASMALHGAAAELLKALPSFQDQIARHSLLMGMAGLVKGERLSLAEFVATAQNFALGGYLSTEFLLSTALRRMLTDAPVKEAYLKAHASGKATLVGELLRLEAPFQLADRVASRHTVLGGVDIAEGQLVSVVYGSANRDPQVFGPNADKFNPTGQGPAGQSLVFGYGAHECIGREMAKAVIPVALDALLAARPHLRLSDEPSTWRTDPYFRGLSSLPARP